MRALRHRPRGGAAVETALLMLIIVPVVMYTLFLEDLLFYKFDQQETVVSTPWDYADLDYREDNSDIETQGKLALRAAKQTFWDHTSAWNTYSDPQHDADSTDHHQALTAHQCWLAAGGHQISCSLNPDVGHGGEFIYMSKGGQVTCHAVLGVQNYFLPQHFFQWWSSVELTSEERWEGDAADGEIHSNASVDGYTYPLLEFAVLTDSWALNSMRDESLLDPRQHPNNLDHKFTDWVSIPYGLRSKYLGKASEFVDQAQSDGFLSSDATSEEGPGPGDDLSTPPVAWSSDVERPFGDHWASGWSDERQSETVSNMENAYFGQSEDVW